MRVLHENQIQGIKISIFEWNNKYIIKYEIPFLEQSFKLPVEDFINLEAVVSLTQEMRFLEKIAKNFQEMEITYDEMLS